jgi:hypothetical protein
MTAEVEARIGAEGPIDARALFEAPLAIVQRILARRIAAAGGRDLSRIGLEKIEALALRLRDASLEERAFKANVGGAVVRLIAAGKLEFSPEPARRVAAVMAGLDPATQVAQPPQRRKSTRVDSAAGSRGLDRRKSVDGRLEPGHDE